MLGIGSDTDCQRSGHGSIPSPSLSGREQEEPNITGHVCVVAAVLPVAVEGEDTLTWGNADEWILIKWLVQRFFAQEHLDISNFAQQEVNLWVVVSEMRIAKLETIFNFRNPDEVKRFLREHKLIIPVLLNTRSIVEEFFGNEVPVALEVVIDPEALNNKQLFGYISTGSMPQDEAFERFNAFDESWFLKQYDLTDGLFNFNLE